MAYNKFMKKDGTVMLDLTGDTVTAETLEKGIIAHDRHGDPITGTKEVVIVEEYDGTIAIVDTPNSDAGAGSDSGGVGGNTPGSDVNTEIM